MLNNNDNYVVEIGETIRLLDAVKRNPELHERLVEFGFYEAFFSDFKCNLELAISDVHNKR